MSYIYLPSHPFSSRALFHYFQRCALHDDTDAVSKLLLIDGGNGGGGFDSRVGGARLFELRVSARSWFVIRFGIFRYFGG